MEQQTVNNLQIWLEKKTKYQTIRLYNTEEGDVMLTLDTYLQFLSGKSEQIYHDVFTRIPYYMNLKAKTWLILGGGDGLMARDIFKLDSNAKVTLVELDEEMIKIFKANSVLTALNAGSLDKCNIIIENALQWIWETKDMFDIIILDLPDANSDELKKLYTLEFYSNVIRHLNPEGVLAIQSHFDANKAIEEKIRECKLEDLASIYYEAPFLGCGYCVVGKKGEI
jgi:spermidine synthase